MTGKGTRLEDYADALRRYLRRELPAEEFRREWSRLNSGDSELRGETVDALLAELFAAVEGFQPDPALRARLLAREPGVYTGDAEFRPLAAAFLKRLEPFL